MADDAKHEGCPGACSCTPGDLYWCDYCNEAFPDKRCPNCGIKLKKMKK